MLSSRLYKASNSINPESLQRVDDDDSGRWDPITYEKFKLSPLELNRGKRVSYFAKLFAVTRDKVLERIQLKPKVSGHYSEPFLRMSFAKAEFRCSGGNGRVSQSLARTLFDFSLFRPRHEVGFRSPDSNVTRKGWPELFPNQKRHKEGFHCDAALNCYQFKRLDVE